MSEPSLNCAITGNPCGTDTWGDGHECQCAACQTYLSLRPDAPSVVAAKERSRQLADQIKALTSPIGRAVTDTAKQVLPSDDAVALLDKIARGSKPCPGCDCAVNENTALEGPNGNLWHQHCLEARREDG